jgi:hypothetical protein
MAYTINKTDGTILATVNDGVLDTTSSLSLIGRNYQSYGEAFNENLVKLLENSSSASAPTAPIEGELWWDKTNDRLKVYTGAAWVNVGVESSTSEPTTGLSTGMLWNDTTNDQLYMYDGTAFDLVGPIFSTADGKAGFQQDSITDNLSATQKVASIYNKGTRFAIATTSAFTANTAPSGFGSAVMGLGINLATGYKIHGTATNADTLDNIDSASFLRSDANDTTSGTLGVLNDTGLTVGVDSDLNVSVSGSDVTIKNQTSDGDIKFNINDGGSDTTALTIDGATADVIVNGNLQVKGTTTSVETTNMTVEDPLLELNRSSSGGDIDSGIYIQRGSAGNSAILYWNEGEDKFKAVLSTSEATATSVTDSSKATLVANYEGDTLTVGSVSIIENEIRANNSNDDLQLSAAGTGNVIINDGIVFEDNEIRPARSNDDLVLTGVGSGGVSIPTTATITTIEATNLGFADSGLTVTGISNDGALGGDAAGVYTNASNSLLVTEEAVKRYVDGNADIYLQIDITGLAKTGTGAGTVANLLETLAPVANFAPLTKAYVAATTSTKDTLSVTVGSVGSIGNVVSGVVTAVSSTVANPTRDNDLIYRVNSGGTAWEYVSGA